jgi:hypothetical protein
VRLVLGKSASKGRPGVEAVSGTVDLNGQITPKSIAEIDATIYTVQAGTPSGTSPPPNSATQTAGRRSSPSIATRSVTPT